MKERKIDVAFWTAEEVEGLALFRKLQQKWEQSDFDDEYLALLAEYKEKYPYIALANTVYYSRGSQNE